MAEILSELASMPRSEMMKPSSMPLETPKTRFSGLSLMLFARSFASPFGLNYDVVDVGLNGPPDEVPETLEHLMLVHSPSVLQTEQHCDVAERSKGGDKRRRELVGLSHRDLVVAGVRIKEAEGFIP